MPFKIINPAWKSATQIKAEQHAPAVLAWLQANPNSKAVTILELRAALPAIAADLTRQVVNQIAQIIGAEVEGADSADA